MPPLAPGIFQSILEKMAPDVAWEAWDENHAQRAGVPWLKPQRGREGVLEFFKVAGALRIHAFSVLSVMAGPNQVAVEVMIDAEIPSTGKRYRDEEIHLWTFDADGKVTRMRHYVDTPKHIAAAGS